MLPVRRKYRRGPQLFLFGSGNKAELIKWDGKNETATIVDSVFTAVPEDPGSGLATARTTDEGDLYGGTHHSNFCSGPSNASFYRYTNNKGLQQLFSGTKTTDGVAFCNNTLFQFDPCTGLVRKFHLRSNGTLCM